MDVDERVYCPPMPMRMRPAPLLAAVLLLLAGCAPASPSGTPAEVAQTATPSPSGPPRRAPDPALREVTVRAVEVGEHPIEGTDAIRVTPGTLERGERLWVLETIEVDGATHHLVVADRLADETVLPFGWIADTLAGSATLAPVDDACPTSPLTVPAAASLDMFGGLACYGQAPIEVVGFTPIGCGIGGSPRTGTPDWLNGSWSSVSIGSAEPRPPELEVPAAISARVAPGAAIPPPCGGEPGWYRFEGHFDDPASETCRTETVAGLDPLVVEPRLSQLLCRAQLVLTAATRLESAP